MAKPPAGKRPITSTVLAKKLGLSQATISLALNDSPLVNVHTRERVKEAALRLNYYPNRLAQAIRTGRTQTIGVIVPSITTSFFSGIVNAIETAAKRQKMQCFLCQSHSSPEIFEAEVRALIGHHVDGLIISPLEGFEQSSCYRWLLQEKIPTVVFDYDLRGKDMPSVISDNIEIGRMATEHLIGLGHRNIAFLSHSTASKNFRDRLQGYRRALEVSGIPYSENLIFAFDEREQALVGRTTIAQLVEGKVAFTGLVTVSDTLAIAAVKALQERKLRVPQNVSVVGTANLDLTEIISPSLTTIDQHPEEIGSVAFELLRRRVQERVHSVKKVVVSPSLIVRESSGPPVRPSVRMGRR